MRRTAITGVDTIKTRSVYDSWKSPLANAWSAGQHLLYWGCSVRVTIIDGVHYNKGAGPEKTRGGAGRKQAMREPYRDPSTPGQQKVVVLRFGMTGLIAMRAGRGVFRSETKCGGA
jgi:hypothetical protein